MTRLAFAMSLLAVSLTIGSSVRAEGLLSRDSANLAPTAVLTYGAEHNVGGFSFGITNAGHFEEGFTDVFTGKTTTACEYPIGSATRYTFWGGYWVGGIVGSDTLVATSVDGWTGARDFAPVSDKPIIAYHSTISARPDQRLGAVSHQEFTIWCTDSCPACPSYTPGSWRYRIPLNIVIRQSSYVWSYLAARDIVIFVTDIFNASSRPIADGYIGLYFDSDVHETGNYEGAYDDLTGFRQFHSGLSGCGVDTLPMAWVADNDGDMIGDTGDVIALPNVTATVPLDMRETGPVRGYNWWISNGDYRRDYGPRMIAKPGDPYRQFLYLGDGTPDYDPDKYYVLSHREIDFDEAFLKTITPYDSMWAYPKENVPIDDYADGYDARCVISCGPFDLQPGDSVRFVWAFVGGRGFHVDSLNGQNLPNDPWTYTAHLNFNDLTSNARMARWIYDNPGFDTDSNGYAGKYRICGNDTVWYEGDGVPDLVADIPPAAPSVTAQMVDSSLIVRWNGFASETTIDRVSQLNDFEGYAVYLQSDSSADSMVRVASYDVADFFRYFRESRQRTWDCDPTTYSLSTLKALYAPGGANDSTWSPQQFTRQHVLTMADTAMYFVPVGCNASKTGVETPIVKRFPAAPQPKYRRVSDVPPESTSVYLDDHGEFKYYDYELTVDHLAPGQRYRIAVTAFDQGSPLGGRTVLESERTPIVVGVPGAEHCCIGRIGNVDCDPEGTIDIADLTALIDNLFISFGPLCCVDAANLVNPGETGVDIADLSSLIDYLFVSMGERPTCQ